MYLSNSKLQKNTSNKNIIRHVGISFPKRSFYFIILILTTATMLSITIMLTKRQSKNVCIILECL